MIRTKQNLQNFSSIIGSKRVICFADGNEGRAPACQLRIHTQFAQTKTCASKCADSDYHWFLTSGFHFPGLFRTPNLSQFPTSKYEAVDSLSSDPPFADS